MAITHAFVSAKADGADSSLVRPSNWNDDHTIADGTFVRTASYIVAPSDAPDYLKEQADGICDGTEDDVQIKALLATMGDGELVGLPGTYNTNSTITLQGSANDKYQKLRFLPGSYILPSSDIDMFALGLCGCLTGGTIYTGGIAYTSTAVTLTWAASKLYDIEIAGALGAGTGTGLKLDAGASARAVAYNHIDDVKLSGFEYGINPNPSGSCTGAWLNRFTRIRGLKVVHFIYEDIGTGAMHSNWYDFNYQAWGDGNDIDMLHIDGNSGRFIGCAYDYAGATSITITANASGTRLDMGGVASHYTKMSDSGAWTTYIDEVTGMIYGKPVSNIQHLSSATHNLTQYQAGTILTNLGSGGLVVANLPQTVKAGSPYKFVLMEANEMRIDPGAAGAIYINGAKQADNAYISADAIGESVEVIADGNGDWPSINAIGTWSVV